VKFFLDNNLPPKLARAIDELVRGDGHRVVHLRDKFPRTIDDLSWLEELVAEGDWVVVTRDALNKVGSKGRPERQVFKEAGLTTFLFVKNWGQYRGWDLVWRFVRWWPEVMRTAEVIEAGKGYLVPINFPTEKSKKLITAWS
jgi:hypothetical protein